MIRKETIVVLGGTGTIGSRVADLLAQQKYRVIRVQRSISKNGRSIQADVTRVRDLDKVIGGIQQKYYIVSAVLDISSPTNLTGTIIKTAENIVRLDPKNCAGIVAITSTAILSPTFLRTDYAEAKTQELRLFRMSSQPVWAVMCPQIAESASQQTAFVNQLPKFVMSADDAAQLVIGTLSKMIKCTDSTHVLVAPPLDQLHLVPGVDSWPLLSCVRSYLRASYLRARQRDRAHYHQRSQTYALLGLMPSLLRKQYDHHLMPINRILKICARVGYAYAPQK